jgi:hypothetical protein
VVGIARVILAAEPSVVDKASNESRPGSGSSGRAVAVIVTTEVVIKADGKTGFGSRVTLHPPVIVTTSMVKVTGRRNVRDKEGW